MTQRVIAFVPFSTVCYSTKRSMNFLSILIPAVIASTFVFVPVNGDQSLGNSTVDLVSKCQMDKNHYNCCASVPIPKMNLTFCTNMTYLTEEYGFELVVTVNGLVIIHERVSARNPPPVCEDDLPLLKNIVELCIYFNNLNVNKNHFTGCTSVGLELLTKELLKYKLFCFDIPFYKREKYLEVKLIQ